MSFTPLPKIFAEFSSGPALSDLQVIEFGCGDGRFRELLHRQGFRSWGMDRRGQESGTVADFLGDALVPPVASRSVDLLLVPNLLRHLAPGDPSLRFLGTWRDLLKPRGSLIILEDEPGSSPAGVAGYRRLQEYLRRLTPEARGPLLPLAAFRAWLEARGLEAGWDFGLVRNLYPVDTGAVLGFLGRASGRSTELDGLRRDIENHGLDCGFYWWARVTGAAEGAGS